MDARTALDLFATIYSHHGGQRRVIADFSADAIVFMVLTADLTGVVDQVRLDAPTVGRIELAARFFADLERCE